TLPPKEQQVGLGRTVCFWLTDVPEGADRTLKASIDAKDDFPLDDAAWLTFGVVRKAKVLILTPDNNFLLRAFFETGATKSVAEGAWLPPAALENPSEYLTRAREGKYDLIVFDRCGPRGEDEMPAANTLFIGHPPPPYKLAGDGKVVTPLRSPTVQGWD